MKYLTYSTILLFLASLVAACGSEGTTDNADNAEEEQAQVQTAEQQPPQQAEPEEQPDQENYQGTVGEEGPEISFEEETHDFGTIPDDTKVSHRFEFTNTGEEPLVIQEVEAGCGCTAPSYSDEPVQSGESGYVDVEYDSGFRDVPHFNQRVTIQANTEQGTHYVAVQGEIE